MVIALLRLPSLFEPYWYGDEQIYLALAQAMNHGAVLYRDIWDNKPPLLYVLYAIHPTLLWAKAAAIVFVLSSCGAVYVMTRRLTEKSSDLYGLVAATLTGIFLSIPFFEGTIANAELFFTLPILAGAILAINYIPDKIVHWKMHLLGLLLFVAFLFKVPAAFDFGGFFAFMFVLLMENYVQKRDLATVGKNTLMTYLPIIASFVILLGMVIAYFYLNHALSDFIIASFSQNASYVAVDSGPLSKLSNPLFIKAFILLASCLLLVAGYFKKLISKELLFLTLWFGFSLYGALLSGRPYLHYLLQVVPPAVILVLYLVYKLMTGDNRSRIVSFGIGSIVAVVFFWLSQMFAGAFHLPAEGYYRNWFDYVAGKKSWDAYAATFDSRTNNSYAIAKYIDQNTQANDPIFVWADAASIYVLADRPAATRFIQAHHLTTIDKKNYDLIIERLNSLKPKIIVVERPVHFAFPKLEELLMAKYVQAAVFNDMYIYQLNGQ